MKSPNPDPEEIAGALALLEALASDRALLAGIDAQTRRRLLRAAGALAHPDEAAQRKLARAFRKQRAAAKRAADQAALEQTGIREGRRQAVFANPPALAIVEGTVAAAELLDPRDCYVCKQPYTRVHHFYDALCPDCGDLNYAKRMQSADLRGRVALVTGGRVKIGYHAVVKLLRAGARVVVTTRFARDAAARFAKEADFTEWRARVEIYGLDLRHTPSVERLAAHLLATLPRLDFVIHNACQTVRRPPAFYAHLLEREELPLAALPAAERPLVASFEELRCRDAAAAPARLSQKALLPEDRALPGVSSALFPRGQFDADLQQVDLRAMNSWRLRMHEVSTIELLEVQLVNAVAPFVLSARLKPLLVKERTFDKQVVNVSAMEGQFNRGCKTENHAHTNMAKAALNMLTRTSAQDWARDGIYMNSVDTGWVTDEDPALFAEKKGREQGATFQPPLDVVDGAARIVDPVFHGINTGERVWGLFLKDYRPVPW